MLKKREKVFVGLSGGVDSSVAAAILQKKGYDITGVFIKVWSPDWLPCTWKEERRDAMKVASHLGIPFLTFDFEKEYKKGVVDYMIKEYKEGHVPNPDIMCNKEIKFGAFLNKAIEMGADKVATGHYVRLKQIAQKLKTQNQKGSIKLLKGIDKNKDQSYFLWTLNQKQLNRCLFPIGEYEKPVVRKMAEKFGLSTAKKKDSQGICFIGKVSMKDFLKHYIEEKSGDVLNEKGTVIGQHSGVSFYTIGQRHGFSVIEKGIEEKPYYVVSKNINKNTITVSSHDEEKKFAKKDINIGSVNWISGIPKNDDNYEAKIRYRQSVQKCNIEIKNNITKVKFIKSQNTAKGQSIVLYKKDNCIGGGVII